MAEGRVQAPDVGGPTQLRPGVAPPDTFAAAPRPVQDNRLGDLADALGSFNTGLKSFGLNYAASQKGTKDDSAKVALDNAKQWAATSTPDQVLQADKEGKLPWTQDQKADLYIDGVAGQAKAGELQKQLQAGLADGTITPDQAPAWLLTQRDQITSQWNGDNQKGRLRTFGASFNSLLSSAQTGQITYQAQQKKTEAEQAYTDRMGLTLDQARQQKLTPEQTWDLLNKDQQEQAPFAGVPTARRDQLLMTKLGTYNDPAWALSIAGQARKDVNANQPTMADKFLATPTAPAGLTEKGNIDLTQRPKVKNSDGSISTVRSMSFEEDGKEVLIPTVATDGSRILSDKEAVDQYRKTGQFLGKFENADAATKYAQALHQQQDKFYSAKTVPSLASKPDYMTTINSWQTQAKTAAAKADEDAQQNTINSSVTKAFQENPESLHGLPPVIPYTNKVTGAAGQVTSKSAVDNAVNETIARDNQRVASGQATPDQVFDEQLHSFAISGQKQTQWEQLLKSTAHGGANPNSLTDPQQQQGPTQAFGLWKSLQAKNPAYAAMLADKQTQSFFNTAVIQQQLFGRNDAEAMQAAQQIWASPKTEEENKALSGQRQNIETAVRSSANSFSGWVGGGVKNPEVAHDAIVDAAWSLVRLNHMDPAEAVKKAQDIATQHFVNVNGSLVPDMGYMPKEQMKPAAEAYLKSWANGPAKGMLQTKGMSASDITLAPAGDGRFVIVNSSDGFPIGAPRVNGRGGGYTYVTAPDLINAAKTLIPPEQPGFFSRLFGGGKTTEQATQDTVDKINNRRR